MKSKDKYLFYCFFFIQSTRRSSFFREVIIIIVLLFIIIIVKNRVPFSMAVQNVKLMHKCSPEHLRMGTTR